MTAEIFMIVFVTCSTLGSQLLVKHAVMKLAQRVPELHGPSWLVTAVTSPEILLAVAVQGVGFIVWVVVVSRIKLGVAFAISGSFFYLLIALSSWLLYGERLSAGQWGGLALVSLGVLLLTSCGQS